MINYLFPEKSNHPQYSRNMSNSILKSFLFFVFCFFNFSLIAQNIEYTDHKPVYRKWQDSYILDKIQYTKNSTIFYFRFVCRSGQGISAIFYPPGGEAPWYLKGKSGKNYNLKSVRNIRRNSELLVSNLTSKKEFPSLDGFGYTVFSCEVHFEKLPNSEKKVDLIEGPGHEFDQNHFNCFDVIMKTQDDKELGQIKDSEENIKKFENKFGVTNTNIKPQPKIEPKIEPKVQPKKEDPIAKIDPPKKEEPKTSPRKADPDNPYPITRVRNKSDIRCNEKMVLDKIQFQDNSTDFKGMVQCQETLSFVYDFLRENPKATATIIGHSDIFGMKEKNLELSRQRAYKVQRWLSMMGISPFRINVEFYGGQQPIVKEGSALNRRVELFIKCN
jgi:outer membrane protein OmpA-like peptidoglycan-associated protein